MSKENLTTTELIAMIAAAEFEGKISHERAEEFLRKLGKTDSRALKQIYDSIHDVL